jgi:hypothetical protein
VLRVRTGLELTQEGERFGQQVGRYGEFQLVSVCIPPMDHISKGAKLESEILGASYSGLAR